ncbi:plasmid mobilization relaxosome protein MobC, partial [Enterococcus faecium]|nr:plasmid mobilization relaxosome protein MobC [Enterococcus faecium]
MEQKLAKTPENILQIAKTYDNDERNIQKKFRV